MRLTVELPTELGEWIQSNGGAAFLRQLADDASKGYLIDRDSGEYPAQPHPGRSGIQPKSGKT